MGARVIVVEVDALKALEALMEGYEVLPIAEAAEVGDVFVTATGNRHVIGLPHLSAMKPGAIVANSGHFAKLESLGVHLDELTSDQRAYLTGWRAGT